MYLIKNYSVDIDVAMDICGIPFLLIDSNYSGEISYSDDHIGGVFRFAHNAIHNIPRT